MRLAGLDTDEPIAYRTQNGGDYDLVPRDHLAPGASGLGLHRAR